VVPSVARGTFAPEIATRKPSGPSRGLFLAVGVVVTALAIVSAYFLFSGGDAPDPAPSGQAATEQSPVGPVDPNSGFDITTEPMGARVKLDGSPLGNAPLRVRNLVAGKHQLEIEGPPGFKSKTQEIVVEQGKAQTLQVRLDPEGQPEVRFQSEPPGARVTLVAEGTGQKTPVGAAPTTAKIDPAQRYHVVFELDGYFPVEKPVVFSGAETTIAAVLPPVPKDAPPPPPENKPEPPKPAPPEPRRDPPTPPRPREPKIKVATPLQPRETGPKEATPLQPKETGPVPEAPKPDPSPPRPDPKPPAPVADGTGKLSIGAKPPCLIFIDGRDIGKTTPVRDLEVPAGTVTITLVNTEFGIREKVTVTVKAGETAKVIKDFSDKIPK
jgi:hypothetical protein